MVLLNRNCEAKRNSVPLMLNALGLTFWSRQSLCFPDVTEVGNYEVFEP